jgi:hypothetical protein
MRLAVLGRRMATVQAELTKGEANTLIGKLSGDGRGSAVKTAID